MEEANTHMKVMKLFKKKLLITFGSEDERDNFMRVLQELEKGNLEIR